MLKITSFILFIFLTIGLHAQEYCLPEGGCDFGDNIAEFGIAGFFNSSGCGNDNGVAGYSDFTDLTGIELGQGVNYSVTLTTGFDNHQVSIWIDIDNSFSFEASELILTDALVGTEPIISQAAIPSDWALGTYRMRVQSVWQNSSSIDPCAIAQSFGETEDYTVSIVSPPSCLPVSDLGASNVGSFELTVQWTENGTAPAWDIEIVPTGETATGNPTLGYNNVNSTQITIDDLEASTDYQIYVRADCGMGDVSIWTGPLRVTTQCASFTTPFLEDFSGLGDFGGPQVPNCWQKGFGGTPETGPVTIGSELFGGWAPSFDFPGSMAVQSFAFFNIGELQDWLISPIIETNNSQFLQVEFDLSIIDAYENQATNLGSDDTIHFLISDDQGTTWSTIQTWTTEDLIEPNTRITTDLSTYGGLNAVFAFYYTNGITYDPIDYVAAIDNFSVNYTIVPVTVDIATTDISCFGASDGMAVANVTGGTAPYTYNWSTEPTGLSSGQYQVTVSDANGFDVVTSFIINEPSQISASISSINETVVGNFDGLINLNVSGGTEAYSFLWNTGDTTEDLFDLGAGTYCVTIVDANDCTTDLCETIMSESTSSRDLVDINLFKVYPNPVVEMDVWLELEFSNSKDIEIQLVNTLGQSLYQTSLINVRELKTQLPTQNLARGLYFVQVMDLESRGLMTEKVLVQ